MSCGKLSQYFKGLPGGKSSHESYPSVNAASYDSDWFSEFYLLLLCSCSGVHICHDAYGEVRGQLSIQISGD